MEERGGGAAFTMFTVARTQCLHTSVLQTERVHHRPKTNVTANMTAENPQLTEHLNKCKLNGSCVH